MSCLQKVVHNIEHMSEKTNENVYISSNRMGSQFRPHNVFKLLASKGPMDGIGGRERMSFIERSNPVNWWYMLPLNFLRLGQNLPCRFLLYTYLDESIFEPEDINMARKIDQTLKVNKLERKCSRNDDT